MRQDLRCASLASLVSLAGLGNAVVEAPGVADLIVLALDVARPHCPGVILPHLHSPALPSVADSRFNPFALRGERTPSMLDPPCCFTICLWCQHRSCEAMRAAEAGTRGLLALDCHTVPFRVVLGPQLAVSQPRPSQCTYIRRHMQQLHVARLRRPCNAFGLNSMRRSGRWGHTSAV